MNRNSINKLRLSIDNFSSLTSTLIHVIVLILFFIFSSAIPEPENLIQVSYGEPGGGSGGFGPDPDYTKRTDIINEEKKEDEQKELSDSVPETNSETNEPTEKIKVSETKTREVPPEKTPIENPNIGNAAGNNKDGRGIGNGTGTGSGTGNGNGDGLGDGLGNGIGIDWGGRVRKIYSYTIPKYPDGTSKEIDIKLKFTILPDGSVSNIIVLRKADAILEKTAIESLRYWRFEPLPSSITPTPQVAIITFPFRLE
ncbi:MAG: energy transducer TonB [bacterium]